MKWDKLNSGIFQVVQSWKNWHISPWCTLKVVRLRDLKVAHCYIAKKLGSDSHQDLYGGVWSRKSYFLQSLVDITYKLLEFIVIRTNHLFLMFIYERQRQQRVERRQFYCCAQFPPAQAALPSSTTRTFECKILEIPLVLFFVSSTRYSFLRRCQKMLPLQMQNSNFPAENIISLLPFGTIAHWSYFISFFLGKMWTRPVCNGI